MRILYLPNHWSQQRQKEKPAWVYPVRLAMEATKDVLDGHDVTWGDPFSREAFNRSAYDAIIERPRYSDFLSLPFPFRKFTLAFDKRYQMYGNYLHHPATHIQSAEGCSHGKCVFCVERGREYQVRPVGHVMEELWDCEDLGFKEVFDDAATLPDGEWAHDFFSLKCRDKRVKDIVFGCNLRIDSKVDFKQMKYAGTRMVLFGIESANQKTLDKIGKGTYAKDIVPTIKAASAAGLEPHIAVMFGYPWESEEEELKTLALVYDLLRKGYARTAQASTYSSPGAAPAHRSPMVNRLYDVAWDPEFWVRQIGSLKSWADVKYLFKKIRKGIVRD